MDAYGEAAAVVPYGAAAVLVQDYLNVGAVAGKGLVHGVVHDLVHAVVQPAEIRGADVHARAFAHGLQAFQHLNLAFIVCVFPDGGVAWGRIWHETVHSFESIKNPYIIPIIIPFPRRKSKIILPIKKYDSLWKVTVPAACRAAGTMRNEEL